MLTMVPLLLTSVCVSMTTHACPPRTCVFAFACHICGPHGLHGCGQTQTRMQESGQVYTHRNKKAEIPPWFLHKHTQAGSLKKKLEKDNKCPQPNHRIRLDLLPASMSSWEAAGGEVYY